MANAPRPRPAARHSAPRPDHSGARSALVALAAVVGVLVVLYGVGVAAFSFVFMPNTTLDGRDVSWKLAADEGSSYAAKVGTYQTQVAGDGLSFSLRGSDIGLAFDQAAYVSGTLAQQDPWTWPLHILGRHEITATSGATFDADKLRSVVQPLVDEFNKGATKPQDATIAYDQATKAYVVKPEVLGDTVNAERYLAEISDALGSLPARIVPTEASLERPSVLSSDSALASAAEAANRFLSANVTLTLGGQTAMQVGRDQVSGWVTLGEDHAATLDQDKMAEWASKEVASKYDTVGLQRTYTRPDGKVVTVQNSGRNNYGWITNEAQLVSDLSGAIESGSTSTLEIPVRQKAQVVPDANGRDWGGRYIDIDLTEQHVRMYGDDGALVWESDAVTGDHAKGHDTPMGVYQLNNYRASNNVELRGQIDPATNEPEYISHVNYWMPFIDNSWALHDADWRSSFGGDIYLTNGSHGCVNLPPDKAAELFGLCKVGDVVVVHS